MKILMQSTLIGCFLGTLPEWPLHRLGSVAETAGGILAVPGIIVSLVFNGGWLHDVNFVIAAIANCAFYGALSYACLRMHRNRR